MQIQSSFTVLSTKSTPNELAPASYKTVYYHFLASRQNGSSLPAARQNSHHPRAAQSMTCNMFIIKTGKHFGLQPIRCMSSSQLQTTCVHEVSPKEHMNIANSNEKEASLSHTSIAIFRADSEV